MDREYVIKHNLVERYLRGELSDAEREAFEIHYLDCPETLYDLQLAQALREGIKALGAEAVNEVDTHESIGLRWWQKSPVVGALAAGLFVVVLSSSALLHWAWRANDALKTELKQLQQPYLNLQLKTFSVQRSAPVAEDIIEIQRSELAAGHLLFELETEYPPRYTHYSLHIAHLPKAQSDEQVALLFQLAGLVPDDRGFLVFSIPAAELDAGVYSMPLFGGSSDDRILEYRFKIK